MGHIVNPTCGPCSSYFSGKSQIQLIRSPVRQWDSLFRRYLIKTLLLRRIKGRMEMLFVKSILVN